MAEETEETPEEPEKKSGKMGLIISVVLALAGGAGGFFAVGSGLIGGGAPEEKSAQPAKEVPDALPEIAFVPLDPIVISIDHDQRMHHLRFRAQLEVDAAYKSDVELIAPRVVDVLNSYLRALKLTDISDPMALMKLRAQMLRRIQIVTGKGRVRDLLVMDFVLN